MPEETNTPKPVVKQPEKPIEVTLNRNNTDIVVREYLSTRGQNPGRRGFKPVIVTEEDKKKFLDHVGFDNVFGIVNSKYCGLTFGWAEDALDEDTGEFKSDKFAIHASQFDASGETKDELKEQLDAAQDEIIELATSGKATKENMEEIAMKMNRIRVAIEAKSRPRKPKAEVVPA